MEAAHQQAIVRVLEWIEDKVAVIRHGRDGVYRVRPPGGLVAARFRHHEARSGRPLLQTRCCRRRRGSAWTARGARSTPRHCTRTPWPLPRSTTSRGIRPRTWRGSSALPSQEPAGRSGRHRVVGCQPRRPDPPFGGQRPYRRRSSGALCRLVSVRHRLECLARATRSAPDDVEQDPLSVRTRSAVAPQEGTQVP
ncbi:relaxase domain-containing protein [Streptomyces clavifer]|uniref:relaxase domain-containing protein n=2 Tax=Streptomyces clavifer TaxID=68188 RepID=UPI0033B63081